MLTPVLGSQNSDGKTGLWGSAQVGCRENPDLECTILMVCRQTKRGNGLRKVVLLKTIQWSTERVPMPLGKCCQRYSRTCEFIAKTGTGRNIHSFSKSWEEGWKAFRIQLFMAEVSLMELATRPSSRKGLYGHFTKIWKYDARERGEVYSLLNQTQNVIG
jgi:hypothetical protein